MPKRSYRNKRVREDRVKSVTALELQLREKARARAAKAKEEERAEQSKIEEDLNAGVQSLDREDAEERTTND